MDPLAEKYYFLSPYAFCSNNPVNFVDWNGEDIWQGANVDSRTDGNNINPFSMTCINMYSVIGMNSLVLNTKYRSLKFCRNVIDPNADTYYFKQQER